MWFPGRRPGLYGCENATAVNSREVSFNGRICSIENSQPDTPVAVRRKILVMKTVRLPDVPITDPSKNSMPGDIVMRPKKAWVGSHYGPTLPNSF